MWLTITNSADTSSSVTSFETLSDAYTESLEDASEVDIPSGDRLEHLVLFHTHFAMLENIEMQWS